MAENPRKIRLDGQRFGRWLVLHQDGNAKGGAALWLSRCDCGTQRPVLGSDLRRGTSTNCGCVGAGKTARRNYRHGGSDTRLYNIWQLMRARCQNRDDPRYGAKGVRVHGPWNDFGVFRDWALVNGYSDDLTIERRDCDGDYCPDNCTWADYFVQAQNRRNVIRMPDGRPAVVVAREHGISGGIYRRRLADGWPLEQAVTWPVRVARKPRPRKKNGTFAGTPAIPAR